MSHCGLSWAFVPYAGPSKNSTAERSVAVFVPPVFLKGERKDRMLVFHEYKYI